MNASLRWRPLWLVIGWGLVAAVIWSSLTPAPPELPEVPLADKLAHAVAYALLMGWFGQLYTRPLMRLAHAFSFVLLGIVLELVQGAGSVRSLEVADMFANGVGVVIGWTALRLGADRVLLGLEQRFLSASPP